MCSRCGAKFSDVKLFFAHFMRGLPQCYKMAMGKKRDPKVDIGAATEELFDHWLELVPYFKNGKLEKDDSWLCKCHKCCKRSGDDEGGLQCQRKKAKLAFNPACQKVNRKFQCYQCDMRLGNRRDLQNHLNGMHTTGMKHLVGDDGRVLNAPREIVENETNIANGERKKTVCSRCGEGFTQAAVFLDHLIERPQCYKLYTASDEGVKGQQEVKGQVEVKGQGEVKGQKRTKKELAQLVEHLAKAIPVYQRVLDDPEHRSGINIWIKSRSLDYEDPICLCGEKLDHGEEMMYKHILECDMDALTILEEEEGGQKKERRRETKAERRRRKNERRKQLSKSGTPNDTHEKTDDIADKPPGVGDGHDMVEEAEPSQEPLNPSNEATSERTKKAINAVETIFKRARARREPK